MDRFIQGGIVFDSDPFDEWMETINKLGESIRASLRGRFHHDSVTDRLLSGRCQHALHHDRRRKAPGGADGGESRGAVG